MSVAQEAVSRTGHIMAMNVVLTGSTGQLGNYILASLLRHPNVSTVWCLNRSADARVRQEQGLVWRGLHDVLPLSGRVEFVQVDFAASGLGLPSDIRDSITRNATHILHCAWPVDWNQAFSSFEPSIQGVTQLIDLTAASTMSPMLFFISSVAAVGNWAAIPGARASVPEEEVDDWKVARFGYGQSKLVAERLLADAARVRGIRTAVCRVGQIGGPVDHGVHGQWPKQEWLPSLVASSLHLGMIPKALGPLASVDWVPVDRLSSIIFELLVSDHSPRSTTYYHVRNPKMVEWRTVLAAMLKVHEEKDAEKLRVSSLEEWVSALETSSSDENLDQNPAVKLLQFFQNLRDRSIRSPRARAAVLEINDTMRRSSTLKMLQGIDEGWVSLWMQQWNFV